MGLKKRGRKMQAKRYDPVKVLRQRDIDPKFVYIDENGIELINDNELNFIFKYLRKNVKKGSMLNLGSGLVHVHQMCAVEDKLSHATALDISPQNNRVVRELLDASQGIGKQRMIDKIDLNTLKILAEAMHKDKSYRIAKTGNETLSSLYKKSRYKGKPDIITADMIKQMDQLGSGELVGGRTYDNVMMLFASFARTRKEELTALLKNIRKRLNEAGRLIIVDVEFYGESEEKIEDVTKQEDQIVFERYSQPYDWSCEEMMEALKEAGFRDINFESHEISPDSKLERQDFGSKYLCFVAHK